MTTRVKVTYVAIDAEEGSHKPIMSASTFEDLKLGLDAYYGDSECLGFTPYQSKYPDEYEGYYQYKVKMIHSGRDEKVTEYIDTVKVYCIEYYPHTTYETNSN